MKKFLATLAAMIILSSTCAAENLKFIDAAGDTGYYYDADSIRTENASVFAVKMAVIKADLNRMYVYDVRILHTNQTYEILASQVLSYDTRAELESDNTRRPPKRYSDKSQMGQMVRLILYGE